MTKQKLYIISFIFFLCASASSAQVTFTDVAESAGIRDIGRTWATWGDYDNDGDADLLSGNLYRNESDGTFVDVTESIGIIPFTNDSPIFLDFDNDGNLDIFVSDTIFGDLLYQNNGDGTFLDVSLPAGMDSKPHGMRGMPLTSFDYDNDGLLDIFVASTLSPFVPNTFYHNEGNGRFRNAAAEIGLDNPRYEGIVPGDYDNDGDLDIFITVSGNRWDDPDPDDQGIEMLYRNEGNGVFTDAAKEAGVQTSQNHLSGLFWDYDNDEDLDLFVKAYQHGDIYGYNILYQNNGDGTFSDVTQQAGILPIEEDCVGTDYGDFDNDGWLDLCLTHWMGDTRPVILYHNNRDGTFTNVSRKVGISTHMSWTIISFIDYDNDGNLDIFFTGPPNTLYRNGGTANHWLSFRLVGRKSNRDAIGARVKVMAGELSMLREIAGGSHQPYHAEHLPVHFGLGQNTRAEVIDIQWPSGIIQTFTDIPAHQRLTIDEFEGVLVVVREVFPALGFPDGGTPVQIQGEHFLPGSQVFWGGVEATEVRIVSPSLITAVTPPGSKGLVDIEVIHPDGKSGILKDGYRYTTLQVTKIIPESGPVTGGITVQIEGYGFQTGSRVQIGNNVLANAFMTTNSISGMLPPGTSGTVDVSVTNPNGEREVLRSAFTYIPPPTIEEIFPILLPLVGGREITIKGSGFIRKPTVQIGGIAAQSVEFISSSELKVRTPQTFEVGTQNVLIINPDGQRDTLHDGVTVLAPPKIKSVKPTSGGLGGGTKITIVGETMVEFQGRSYPSRFIESRGDWVKVFIGDIEAKITVQSDHVITAITPPNTPGAKDIKVINPDGEDDTLENAFIYNPLPQITRVIPDNGRLAGGTKITIRGGGFLSGAKVLFKMGEGSFAKASEVQVVSDSIITAQTPSGEPGQKDVVVRNPDRQEIVLPSGFTYNAMPTIRNVSPNHGPSSGGTKLLIEGTGFLPGAKVIIGKRPATTEMKDESTIEAVTPKNPQGVFDVRVINPDTQEALRYKGFVSVGEVAYNYPNPFRAEQGTTFRYVTNERVELITVKIFNLAGVPIGVVGQSNSNEVRWHDVSVHAGLYVYLMDVRLENGEVKKFKRMLEVYK